MRFEVEGKGPGDEIALQAGAPSALRVVADVVSIAPLDSIEVLVNGEVVQTVRASDPLHAAFDGRVEVPQGGWVALRASGPSPPTWEMTTPLPRRRLSTWCGAVAAT